MNVFKYNNISDIYQNQGYVHIPTFITKLELKYLKHIYIDNEKSFFDRGFHRTLDLKNQKKKELVCNEIASVVTHKAQLLLNNYRMLLTSFMTKEKGSDVFDIHQNWTFVEEDKYTSLVIWIPLQDVDESNGCMFFIPGSDKWDKGIRGNNIPWQYEGAKSELLKQMVPLPMKAGDAVIFDDATLHYTSANKTNIPRISIAQVMIPNEAHPVFYSKDLLSNKIEKFKIKDDFYITFTNKYLKGDMSSIICSEG